MCNIPYVIKCVWSKSTAERHGLLQHWTVNIFISISLSLFVVSLINCFKVWYLILTLGWGVGEGGWPCFAERLSWLGRCYKQLVFMASLANVIFYCFPVAQGVSKMGFWFVFCFLCERVPRCRPDQPLQFALWVPTMLGSYWKPSTLLFAYFWFDFYFILVFFWSVWVFVFPARLGGHEAKGTKWPHSAILCQRRRSREPGPVLPQPQEAENPPGHSGSRFPTENPSLSLAHFGTDTKAESGVGF